MQTLFPRISSSVLSTPSSRQTPTARLTAAASTLSHAHPGGFSRSLSTPTIITATATNTSCPATNPTRTNSLTNEMPFPKAGQVEKAAKVNMNYGGATYSQKEENEFGRLGARMDQFHGESFLSCNLARLDPEEGVRSREKTWVWRRTGSSVVCL
jgi:hypothetical protein